MADEIASALIGAVIGSIGGSVGAIFVSNWLSNKGEKQKAYENVVQKYLLQLQDAVDSLWYRFHNLRDLGYREPSERLAETYYATSMLYALGKVLAFKHMIVGEGAYYNIELVNPGMGHYLKQKFEEIESTLDKLNYDNDLKVKFFRYDRQTLAELIIQRDGENVHTSTFLEFRQRYDDPDSKIRPLLEPAKEFIQNLKRDQFDKLMDDLSMISKKLEPATGIDSTIKKM